MEYITNDNTYCCFYQEMYKKAAEFWAELRVELLSASAVLNEEKPNSSQLWRVYWSSHQVHVFSCFWHYVCHFSAVTLLVLLLMVDDTKSLEQTLLFI